MKKRSLILLLCCIATSLALLLAFTGCEKAQTPASEEDHTHVTVWETIEEPTCTTAGTRKKTCKVCGKVIDTEKLLPLGHEIEYKNGAAPTCTEPGNKIGICTRCNKVLELEEVPALGHDIEVHDGTAPTCTEVGWNEYVSCSRCDYTTYTEIPAIGHDIVVHDGKAPTCTEIGWSAYETCTRCDYTTYSEIPALGHNIIYHAGQAATCTEIGWSAYETCTRCDYTTYSEIPATGHTAFVSVVENNVVATCTTAGGYDTVVYCTVCSDEVSRTHTNILVLGHNYQNGTCTRCGTEKPKVQTGVCPVCGKELTAYCRHESEVYFGMYPQTEVTDSTVTAALTTAAGTLPTSENSRNWESYKYYIEGEVQDYMWYIDITLSGETYRGVYFTIYRPYWTYGGSDASYFRQEENGYNINNVYWFKWEPIKWRILEESNGYATLLCEMMIDSQNYYINRSIDRTIDGKTVYTNNYQYSTIRAWLNETFYETAFNALQKAIIQMVEVDNSAQSTTDNTATQSNVVNNKYACDNTNDKVWLLSMQEATKAAYGFATKSSTDDTARRKQPTGYARCQGAYTNYESPEYAGNGFWWLRSPLRSDYRYVSKIRSYGYSGITQVNCTDAGVVPALKIALNNGNEPHVHTVVIDAEIPATCTEDGLTQGSHCSVCGEVITARTIIPATGHAWTFNSFVWAEVGFTAQAKYICQNDNTHVDYHDADVDDGEISLAATCTTDGTRTYTATYDGHNDTKDEVIPAFGHNYWFNSFVWDEETHTAQAKYVCQNDNSHVLYYGTDDGVVINSEVTTDPTCTTTGTRTYTASYDGHQDTYEEDIDPLGHDYQFDSFVWTSTATGYTAQAKYICRNDNTHEDYHDADVDDGEITTAPTCTNTGVRTYTASYDGNTDTKDEIISALGHDIVNHTAQAATCTEKGWNSYETCTRCSYSTYIEIPALGHNYVNDVCSRCGEAKPDTPTPTDEYCFVFTYISSSDSYSIKGKNKYELPEDVVIPSEYNGKPVTSIAANAFEGYSDLESIIIPSSVTSIGSWAFSGCSGLTSIEIPASVMRIDYLAFESCSGLTSVLFEENSTLTYINNYAFKNCGKLTSVEIPASVTFIDSQAFSGCGKLTSIEVAAGNTKYKSIDGNLYTYDGKTLRQYAVGKQDTSFTVPSTVTYINEYAFCNCDSLASIEIPASVTSIGQYAFYSCNGLTSIEIPASVTSIGQYAFYSCNGLTSIEIPASVTSIGQCAFYDCDGLTSISFGENSALTSIGNSAFSNCSKLESVSFGENSSLTSIENYAFKDCSGLESISFGENSALNSIGENAFNNCNSLASIEIPASVLNIGDYAFIYCYGLTDIRVQEGNTAYKAENGALYSYSGKILLLYAAASQNSSFSIPSTVTSILEYAFYKAKNLTSVTIPSSVKNIGQYAFYDCDGLTSVSFGANSKLTSIGQYAFYICNGLTSIEIPASVTSIGNYAFEYCPIHKVVNRSNLSLTVGSSDYGYVAYNALVIIDKNGNTTYKNGWAGTEDGFLFDTDNGNYRLREYVGDDAIVTLPLTFNEKSYDIYCFQGASEVIIPEGFTSISNNAFDNCSDLTSITIPNSVTSIGEYAFFNCSGLTSVTIGNSITSIGSSAFYYCYKLIEVYNKSNLNITKGSSDYGNVGYYAKDIYTSPYTSKLSTDSNGYIVYTDGNSKILVGYSGNESVLILPNDITEINHGAFYNCSGLTSITIPDSVTSIGDSAFYNCNGLTSITIPDSVTSIGDRAFSVCSSLTSIEIPDSVTSIGIGAFGGCNGLTSVTFGENSALTSIDQYAFNNCSGLTSITIPNSVTSIGSYAFYYCSGLTSITIPNSVTSIGNSAFQYCYGLTTVNWNASNCTSAGSTFFPIFSESSNLTTINIGDNVKNIPSYAFRNCSGLTSITIPNSVTSIGDYAFRNCSGLTSISFNGTKAQWQAISKGSYWKSDVPSSCVVHCTDGDINI